MPEVYGIRLPPVEARLTAPNFTLIPRSAVPKSGGETSTDGNSAVPRREGTGQPVEEEEEEEDDDDDDDEEMEDVTAGMGGGGTASGSHRSSHSEAKRKADQLDDGIYD